MANATPGGHASLREPSGRSNDHSRRVSLIPARPGEGRLTEPTAAIQPWRRALIFVPPNQISERSLLSVV